jgi:phosphoribosylanthranilate isomerase
VYVPSSLRAITCEAAARIIAALPPFVTPVGVFVRPSAEDIREAARVARIAVAQVHDAPDLEKERLPVRVLHAVRVKPGFDLAVLRQWGRADYLLDAHVEGRDGGTGQTFDWKVAAEAGKYARIVLAGGLNPENVGRAIEVARPYAVDVSTGVESAPGIKSAVRIVEFVSAVRSADV